MIFPNLAGCRQRLPELDAAATPEQVLAAEPVRAFVAEALAKLRRESSGSSLCATRALFLGEPASIDAGEVTDKAYLNQRQVLQLRAPRVAELYSDDSSVIHA